MTSPDDELVEKIARMFCENDGSLQHGGWGCYKKQARAAIAVVLEEAAKVAESYWHQTRNDVFKGVATAIRALNPKER